MPRSFKLYRVAVAVSVLCIALALIGLIAVLIDKNAMTGVSDLVWCGGNVQTYNHLGKLFLGISFALILSSINAAKLALEQAKQYSNEQKTGAIRCFVVGIICLICFPLFICGEFFYMGLCPP